MLQLREPEIMDQPTLDAASHLQALKGLQNINLWTKSAEIIWQPILKLAKERNIKSLSVLDIATGYGDLPITLWHKSKQHDLNLQLFACDFSTQALELAKTNARNAGAKIEFFPCNILSDHILDKYDIVTNSLFLHHLDPDQGIVLLKKMSDSAKKIFLLSDLIRSRMNLFLTYIGTRLLSKSPVVHHDGPVSVRAAYNINEVKTLIATAGIKNTSIQKHLPCRFLLTGSINE